MASSIQALAYFVAQSKDVSTWQRYAEQVLGAQTAPAPGGGLYLKLDERAYRIAIVPGAEDHYYASGWELPDRAAFDASVAAVRAAGVEVYKVPRVIEFRASLPTNPGGKVMKFQLREDATRGAQSAA
jgi:3,4-dihydroxy-9,10-secoandrosta-1,3,5(10)-triene-9,17-dione 4,5-dioxygenase